MLLLVFSNRERKKKLRKFWNRVFKKFEKGDRVVFTDLDGQKYFCKVVQKLAPADYYEIEVSRGALKGMSRVVHKGEIRHEQRGEYKDYLHKRRLKG